MQIPGQWQRHISGWSTTLRTAPQWVNGIVPKEKKRASEQTPRDKFEQLVGRELGPSQKNG